MSESRIRWLRSVAPYASVAAVLLVGFAIYAVDRGVFVGSEVRIIGNSSENMYLTKRCKYMFIEGMQSSDAVDGISLNLIPFEDESKLDIVKHSGHCRLFAN